MPPKYQGAYGGLGMGWKELTQRHMEGEKNDSPGLCVYNSQNVKSRENYKFIFI